MPPPELRSRAAALEDAERVLLRRAEALERQDWPRVLPRDVRETLRGAACEAAGILRDCARQVMRRDEDGAA